MPRDYDQIAEIGARHSIETPRLFHAYDQGWKDFALGIKDNPYPDNTGLALTYIQGWKDHQAETNPNRKEP